MYLTFTNKKGKVKSYVDVIAPRIDRNYFKIKITYLQNQCKIISVLLRPTSATENL